MLGLRQLTRRLEAREETVGARSAGPSASLALPGGLLVGVGIHIVIDGLLLGIGFAAGAKEGKLLAVALGVELLSLGLATAVALREKGQSRGRTVGIMAGLSLGLLLGVGAGTTVLRGLPDNALEIVLSFGLAALLFLVTEELLTEAHEEPESLWLTSAFFAGFLLFLVLGMLA